MRNTIEINSKALAGHLDGLRGVINRRDTIPALANVLIEAQGEGRIRLTATDLSNTLRVNVEHDGDFDGALCVSLDRLHAIAKALPDSDMTIKLLQNKWAEVVTVKGTFKLAGIGREQFPQTPEVEGPAYEVAGKDFLRGLARVAPDMDDEFGAGGVLVELNGHLRFVATDRSSLSVCDIVPDEPFLPTEGKEAPASWLIPRKAVAPLRRVLSEGERVVCQVGENQFCFRQSGVELTAGRPDGQFPAYGRILDALPRQAVALDVDELLQTLNVFAAFGPESVQNRYRPAVLNFDRNRLTVTAQTAESEDASSEMECETEAEESFSIKFDTVRVRGALSRVADSPTVLIEKGKSIIAVKSSTENLTLTQVIALMQ